MDTRFQSSPSEEWAAGIAACSTRAAPSFTRKEIAGVFGVSSRTVARWEQALDLPTFRANARVLRYPIEAVLLLSASGVAIDRRKAIEMGLVPEALFAAAGRLRAGPAPKDLSSDRKSGPAPTVVDDDRRLASLWAHPECGPVLRALVRLMSDSMHSFETQGP
jgi:DNA-binding XRE family transcriptional regulator